jgi:single-strand DNA-binding protein
VLALHVRDAVRRGDPLVVIGKLKTEEWTKDDARYSRMVLEALAVGHDLNRGVSLFRKTTRQAEHHAPAGAPLDDPPSTERADGGDTDDREGLAQVS